MPYPVKQGLTSLKIGSTIVTRKIEIYIPQQRKHLLLQASFNNNKHLEMTHQFLECATNSILNVKIMSLIRIRINHLQTHKARFLPFLFGKPFSDKNTYRGTSNCRFPNIYIGERETAIFAIRADACRSFYGYKHHHRSRKLSINDYFVSKCNFNCCSITHIKISSKTAFHRFNT